MSARSDRGQVLALELVLAVPVVLAMVAFVVYLGRETTTAQRLADAAQAAARAASQADGPAAAEDAARSTALAAASGVPCAAAPSVAVAVEPGPGGTWPGAVVQVRLSCTVRAAVLSPVWVPGSRTLHGSDRQVVDRFQEG